MFTSLKAALAAASLLLVASAAQATVLDFTDPTTYDISGSTLTGDGFASATATGGPLNISEAGPGAIGPLAGTVDGLGIGDDEISFPNESFSLSFSDGVTLTAIYLLDFFMGEQMFVSNGVETVTFTADAAAGDTTGFFAGGLGLTGSTFTFTAGQTDDVNSVAGDFALAGVSFSVVPLPAAMLLLLGALGGLTLLQRRGRLL